MKLTLLLILLSLSSKSWAANPENYRCWSDPGFSCVIKIDVENKKVCSTGCGGADYECDSSKKVVELTGVSHSQEAIGADKFPAQLFTASSKDGSTKLEIAIFDMEFPRPDFPQHTVSPANLRVSSGLFGYPTSEWTRKPDGIFNWDTDFYCLSEKYFVP